MTDKNSISLVSLFCPYFCRKNKGSKIETKTTPKSSEWELTNEEVKTICKYLNISDDDGFSDIFPHKLHNKWEEYILPDLYEIWILYIYGSKDEILPNFKRFSELVKGQWAGSLDVKTRIIFALLLRKDYEETATNTQYGDGINALKINKYDIIKYFFVLFATLLRGLGLKNNAELLMWMNCDADLNEHKLRIAIMYFAEELPEEAEQIHLRKLLNHHYILSDVLRSAIEICFGIVPLTNRMIPFPISFSNTILDVAHVVLLNSLVGGGVDLYEWEMLYSTSKQGCSWSTFKSNVLDKGPTILILRDREDWIFGGYASRSWKLSNKFYGNGRCFLFRLYPTFKIFRPSFFDENFMYLNREQESSPSGLGMGGDWEHFGIWLNIDNPVGKCHTVCPTFKDYECLSATNNFFYIDMEVWHVHPKIQCFQSPSLLKTLSSVSD